MSLTGIRNIEKYQLLHKDIAKACRGSSSRVQKFSTIMTVWHNGRGGVRLRLEDKTAETRTEETGHKTRRMRRRLGEKPGLIRIVVLYFQETEDARSARVADVSGKIRGPGHTRVRDNGTPESGWGLPGLSLAKGPEERLRRSSAKFL
jgi:hypothetical protein